MAIPSTGDAPHCRHPGATIFIVKGLDKDSHKDSYRSDSGGRRLPECNLWRSLGRTMTRVSAANGDACPEGPARALSGEAAIRFSAVPWARRRIEALERARRRSAAAAVAGGACPRGGLDRRGLRDHRRRRIDASAFAARARSGTQRRRARGRHARHPPRRAARRGADRLSRRRPKPRSFGAFSRLIPTSGSLNRSSSTATGAWSNSSGRKAHPSSRWRALVGAPRADRPRAPIRAAWFAFKRRAATINSPPCGLFRRPPRGWPLLRQSIFISPSGAARRW